MEAGSNKRKEKAVGLFCTYTFRKGPEDSYLHAHILPANPQLKQVCSKHLRLSEAQVNLKKERERERED